MSENLHNKIKFVSGLIHDYEDFSFDGFILSLKINNSEIVEIKKTLEDLSIPFNASIENEISIDIRKSKQKIKAFLDIDIYLKDFKLSNLKEDFAILSYENSYLFYSSRDLSFTTKEGTKQSNSLIDNTTAYLNLKDKLSSISDYQNTANNEYVFYTSTKGIFKLTYSNISPSFEIEIKQSVDNLLIKLESTDFKLFFVNELFDFLKASSQPFKDLIFNIESIVSSAERNQQLYLKNFSFEEFRDKLQSEKTNYFNNLREILSKVLNQLISIPISISAVVFTVYKIDSVFPLIIVLIGYLVYLFYFIKFQSIYFKDITELYLDFQKDFKEIKDKSGLPLEEITKEEQKITRRVSNIKTIIYSLITSTSILSIILVVFILSKISLLSTLDFFGNFVLPLFKILSRNS